MLDALRVLWKALVGLYDEALVLVRGNLLWFALAVPLYLVATALLLPVTAIGATDDAGRAPIWPFALAALLVVVMPSPGAIGVGALAEVIARRDSPPFDVCSSAVRAQWRRGLAVFAIGIAVFAALVANLAFYAVVAPGALRFVSVVWLYGLVFWLGMQLYVVPLLLRLPGASFRDLYRRSALLTLGHPMFSATLVLLLLAVAALAVLALPAYLLLAGSYAAMAQALAFRLLRAKHGGLPAAESEGAS